MGFTVLGSPCLGLNGSPAFRHSEPPFRIATDNQAETDRCFPDAFTASDGFSVHLHDVRAEGLDDCYQLLMLRCWHFVLVKGL